MYAKAAANTSIGTAYIYGGDNEIPAYALLDELDNGSAAGKGRTEYVYLPMEKGDATLVNGETGETSLYVGAGLVVGSSFSFAPRVSPQFSATGGDTSGLGYRANFSTPGVAGPFGVTGSISGSAAGGVTVQGGPAVAGGQPSFSATIGYAFKK